MQTLAHIRPFHFPIAFPEVFLRDRSGFDVILGNPPWEEATVEENAFWARHVPGLRGLNQREQESVKAGLRDSRPDLLALYKDELDSADAMRKALVTGPYPGMGTGDPDVYKAFCWRFQNLVAKDGGWMGVVLPRSALSAKGSTEFRIEALKHSNPFDVTMLVNNRQWVFSEVHPQYSIGLIAIRQGDPVAQSVRLRGPFNSEDRFDAGRLGHPAEFTTHEVLSWTDTASLPLLPTEESLAVFAPLRKSPRLDLNNGKSWRARPHRELDATNDKKLMDVDSENCPSGFWPVYKGESFDIWQPDTGRYYAWADRAIVIKALQPKRVRARTNSKSTFFEFIDAWRENLATLPSHFARIAFRDVSRATDSRPVRLALVAPTVFITNQAPYFAWPRGNETDVAFLLGVLSSIPLDWYARRFVETRVNFWFLTSNCG